VNSIGYICMGNAMSSLSHSMTISRAVIAEAGRNRLVGKKNGELRI
jgi:hypothetical protein